MINVAIKDAKIIAKIKNKYVLLVFLSIIYLNIK